MLIWAAVLNQHIWISTSGSAPALRADTQNIPAAQGWEQGSQTKQKFPFFSPRFLGNNNNQQQQALPSSQLGTAGFLSALHPHAEQLTELINPDQGCDKQTQ